MKENYIPQKDRKKILLLGDDLRYPSGVGTMCKEIVLNTAHHFNWYQIAAAIKHPDEGKILDLSDSINKEVGISDANVRLQPNSGYGTMELLRQVIKAENPDALMIFTDPRYWIWLFQNEREIRTQIPIIYYNIWDNLPYPMYNKPYYESCDALFAISKQTRNINEVVLGEKAKDKVIRYIPHGVSNKYFPIPDNTTVVDGKSSEYEHFKQDLRGGKEFVLLYNARNLGRKRTADLILAWRHFCDHLTREEAKKCRLIMHTDPVDNAGTDLIACYDALCDKSYVDVQFVADKFDTEHMNYLYNSSDGVILISSAEGWGLSITEAMMTGKMFIATVTGGMQDQMRFTNERGEWIDFNKEFPSNHTLKISKHGKWAIAVSAESGRSLVGSPLTPYIYDDRTPIECISDAIFQLYELGPEKRKEYGMKGHDWACSSEAGFTAEKMGRRMIEGIEATLENFKEHPRERYELLKIGERPSTYVNYDPVSYEYELL